MDNNHQRVVSSALKVTITIVTGWMAYEGFSHTPIIPTKGDVPTIASGATHYEDGTRVTMSDPRITRERGDQLTINLLEKTYGPCVRKSLKNSLLSQREFEWAVDFSGQYGCSAWNNSTMLKSIHAQDYTKACQAYIQYRFITDTRYHAGWTEYKPGKWKFDCATPGNKTCKGVWNRQLDRYLGCMAVQ